MTLIRRKTRLVLTPEEEALALEILEYCIEPRAATRIIAHFRELGRDTKKVQRMFPRLRNPKRELLQKLVGTSSNAVYGTTKLGMQAVARGKTGHRIA
jgi:hypothetical protein